MKKPLPSKLPAFKSDEEIAAFMEQYSAFDLVDAGLAVIVPTPEFVRNRNVKRPEGVKRRKGERGRNGHKKFNRMKRKSEAGIFTGKRKKRLPNPYF